MSVHHSHLKICGVVQHVVRVPDSCDIMFVIEDRSPTSSSHIASLSKNIILLLLSGDWALSCSFAAPGDDIEIVRFVMEQDYGSGSLTNKPHLVALASGVAGLPIPRTTLTISPCPASELVIIRKKRIVINFSNVGNLSLMDLTDKEQKAMVAEHQQRIPPLRPPQHHDGASPLRLRTPQAPPPLLQIGDRSLNLPQTTASKHMAVVNHKQTAENIGIAGKNCFTAMDRYYDVIFGQRTVVNRHVDFLERVIGSKTKVLDAGSGSGLYAFTLRSLGTTDITCIDASATMLRVLEEKNRFFETVESDLDPRQRKPRLRTVPGDISSFALSKIDQTTGEMGYEDFSTVLCLGVLAYLPSFESVENALHCLSLHTSVGGQLVVTIPNADIIAKKGNVQETQRFAIDRASMSLCIGATSAMPQGYLDVVLQTLLIDPRSNVSADPPALHPTRRTDLCADGVPRRVRQWIGSAFHPDSQTEEGLFVQFRETTTEILVSAAQFENAAKKNGFDVEALYGSLDGCPFTAMASQERVYVLSRREDQFGGDL